MKRDEIERNIQKGQAFLDSLPENDPKREAAMRNLGGLRGQLDQMKPEPEIVVEPYEPYEPPPMWQDPRPDLSDDSGKWAQLLRMAAGQSLELCGVLNGMRCGGTRIKVGRLPSGQKRWILGPDIDNSRWLAWESQGEYNEMRDKYLKPHYEAVTELLISLEEVSPIDEQVEQLTI